MKSLCALAKLCCRCEEIVLALHFGRRNGPFCHATRPGGWDKRKAREMQKLRRYENVRSARCFVFVYRADDPRSWATRRADFSRAAALADRVYLRR